MKTKLSLSVGAAICAVLLSVAVPTPAHAQLLFQDNFSSGNDALWTRMSLFAGSSGQTWSASTGAYRMTAIANGFNSGSGAYGFVGSAVTGLTVGDAMVQADVVGFQGPGPYGGFGVASRLNNLNSFLGLTGYAFVYEPFGNGLAGDIRIEAFGSAYGYISGISSGMNVSLSTANQYTMKFSTFGSQLTGELWQVGGGLIGSVSCTDASYASGSVGALGLNQAPMPPLDFTIDNFAVVVPEPGTGLLLGLGLVGFLAARARRS